MQSEKRIKNIKGRSIQLKNRIKNIEGQSTSSEEAPEYFGTKGTLSLKNENIMCDSFTHNIRLNWKELAMDKHSSLLR
jgi:hypothetical protein